MASSKVHVAELWRPGSRIQAATPEQASRFESYTHLLVDVDPSSPPHAALREKLLQEKIAAGPPTNAGAFLHMRLQAEVEAKRATWAEGAWPHAYRNIEVRLYARAFVYALDTINQILGRLAAESQVPVEVGVAHEEFRNAVPNLRPLRNSLHHAEDRGLGENRNRKPIVAKPITAGPIRTAGGELVIMESLAGDTFSGTADDGSHSSVDVTASTLEASQKAIQRVLGAFAWVDDPEHLPS